MKSQYIYFLLVSIFFLVSCESEFESSVEDNEVYRTGEADFSNYVSLGNSLTAGFADNALYLESQKFSYPNILAQQFSLVSNLEFTQPLMDDNLGGLLLNGNPLPGFGPRLVLSAQSGSPLPTPLSGNPQTDIANVVPGPINNLGVPGAKSFHLGLNGYGNVANVGTTANPYFVRFASNPNASMIEDAVAQSPTFFSLWIGNNDVLSYATSGGVGTDQTGNPDPTTYASTDITDPTLFGGVFQGYVDALTTTASGGVLYNIPDVTSIPFFTTVPNNALVLDATNAANLTGFFQAVAGILTQSLIQQGVPPEQAQALASQYAIPFNEGPNRFLIDTAVTPSNPLGFRQMTEDELLLLTISQSALAQGYGSVVLTPEVLQVLAILQQGGTPTPEQAQLVLNAVSGIDDQDVLDMSELNAIANARMSYNAIIESIAQDKGLAFVDVNQLLIDSQNGVPFDGGVMTSDFVTGGAFSLDAVHLTPRGYAYIANATIQAINETYGSTLPTVNLGDYRTIATSDNTAQ
jgi:hypothetical protein